MEVDTLEAERLVDAYGDTVYRFAYARTGNRADAEDVTQETFLRMVRSAPEFQNDEHCRAWLLRVAMNCAGDLFRSAWRRRSRPLEAAAELTAQEECEEGGVLAAVLALPERYRTVVHLYYFEALSTAEIAKVLGKSAGAVCTRLSRARAMLRKTLEEGKEHDA